jgi:UDP-N-acetylglucosamine--N-acetylmuramyl-(pentapeptide) pyrophosphoryl-undecaprenol N-acetylglucosamine transferase
VDAGSLQNYGFESKTIDCHGLKGKNPYQLLKAIVTLPRAYMQALKVIREFKPDIVFGVGGYVTGPVVSAAKSMGIPAVIHEQNSVPGLANRKLVSIVDRICLSLPGSGEQFPQNKVIYTGNPVRIDIRKLARNTNKKSNAQKTVLVLGGSQGAKAINDLFPKAIGQLDEAVRENLRVIHQTGDKNVEGVRRAYEQYGIEVQVEPFFKKMEMVYRDADLIVSRAGATTLAEISVLGKPAILIPYPHAADNHQQKNGEYYVNGGAAVLFTQKTLTAAQLGQTLAELLTDPQKREKMSIAMKKLSYPDAAESIVRCCLERIEGRT